MSRLSNHIPAIPAHTNLEHSATLNTNFKHSATLNTNFKHSATLIRLQRIYNFLLFHAIIVSILDVYYAIIYHFFGTNLLTQCPVPVAVFCMFLVF
jgi:hypothetical protein